MDAVLLVRELPGTPHFQRREWACPLALRWAEVTVVITQPLLM